MSRRILFIMRQAPYGTAVAHEVLDAALVAGVFELAVTVLFIDDGVYQLLRDQHGETLGSRDAARALTALPTYDVERLYASRDALAERGLDAADLVLPVELLDRAAIAALLAEQDVVISG
jgi:tRNA 2-thiouridine synthesizing protein C